MKHPQMLIVLSLLVTAVTCLIADEVPRRTPARSDAGSLTKKHLLFSKGKKIFLRELEASSQSKDGKFACILNLPSKTALVYDETGKQIAKHSLSYSFEDVAISSSGMLVFSGHFSEMGHYAMGRVSVLDPKGKVIKEFDQVSPGPGGVQFIDNGSTAAILVQQRGTPRIHVVTSELSVVKDGPRGTRPGAITVSSSGEASACSFFKVAREDESGSSTIIVYLPKGLGMVELSCPGSYVVNGQMAFCPGDKELLVVGPGFVKCYDLKQNGLRWRQPAGSLLTGTIPTGNGIGVAVVGNSVISTHRVPTGPGYRYLVSVYERSGRPRRMFVADLGDRKIATNSVLTGEKKMSLRFNQVVEIKPPNAFQLKIEPRKSYSLTPKGQ